MKKLFKHMLVTLSMLFLVGCLSPVKLKPVSNYLLTAVPENICVRNRHASTIMVLFPETVPVYNTTGMAYSLKPYKIAYYSQNAWAATPGQMFLPLLVKTLQNTHYFHAVVTPNFLGRYDYQLNTQITRILQDFSCCPAEVAITVRVQLSSALTNRVIAAREFTAYRRITVKPPYGGVLAANCAIEEILAEIRDFVLCKLNQQRGKAG